MASFNTTELKTIASWVQPAAVAAALTPAQLAVIAAELAKLAPSTGATRLFSACFDGATLGPLQMFGNGAWQDISGGGWPPQLWGGTGRLQLIAGNTELVTALSLPAYLRNALQSVTGHEGSAVWALYSEVSKSVGGALVNWDATQTAFELRPAVGVSQGDLYLAYWLKLQPDLLERMTVGKWAGRVITDWKTGGDYRVILHVFGDGVAKRLYWNLKADNVANGGLPEQIFFELSNWDVPVPVGQWFKVEAFVHRSAGDDGRVWMAAAGQKLFDRYGSNMGVDNKPWNRVFPFLNYSSGQQLPAYQWVEGLELWDGFPAGAAEH